MVRGREAGFRFRAFPAVTLGAVMVTILSRTCGASVIPSRLGGTGGGRYLLMT
jgi:hypothetical protein